jgi:hypothetical protein
MEGGKMMNSVVSDYVAEKVISDIRSGTPLSAALCDALTTFPLIERLRQLIRIEDFESLRALCESTDETMQNLGLALLRNIESAAVVRQYLQEMWKRDDLHFRTRIGLQFQLSNDPDLDPKMRQSFLTFILGNWQKFLENQQNWCGTGEDVIAFCSQRLTDSKFPTSKRWLYLCVAAAASDTVAARQLVKDYENDFDPFTREVAAQVLVQLA